MSLHCIPRLYAILHGAHLNIGFQTAYFVVKPLGMVLGNSDFLFFEILIYKSHFIGKLWKCSAYIGPPPTPPRRATLYTCPKDMTWRIALWPLSVPALGPISICLPPLSPQIVQATVFWGYLTLCPRSLTNPCFYASAEEPLLPTAWAAITASLSQSSHLCSLG